MIFIETFIDMTCSILSLPMNLYQAIIFDKTQALDELVAIADEVHRIKNSSVDELMQLHQLSLERIRFDEAHRKVLESSCYDFIKKIDKIAEADLMTWMVSRPDFGTLEKAFKQAESDLSADLTNLDTLLTELTSSYVTVCTQVQSNVDTSRNAVLALTLNSCADILDHAILDNNKFNIRAAWIWENAAKSKKYVHDHSIQLINHGM